MTMLAALDGATVGAIGVMVVGVVSAVVVPFLSRGKNRAEAESIATRTTLEVNEDLRTEIRELRERSSERIKFRDKQIETLERQLRDRDERIETLEHRVAQLRRDVDVLEAEIVGLRTDSG